MAGAFDEDEDAITGINVTPLVDITLVLLIIFMMTASYIVSPAIKVDLPKAAAAEDVVQSTIALVITREGDVFLNNKKVDDDAIRAFIKNERDLGKTDLEAIIAADGSVEHRRVVGLIDLIKGEGIAKFAINTQAEFTSDAVPDEPEPETATP